MSRHVTFYHRDTGLLNGVTVFVSDEANLAPNTPSDHIAIDHPQERQLDHRSQRVDLETGTVVDWQPPQPSMEHEWNPSMRRWVLNTSATERAAQRQAALLRIAALEAAQHRPVRDLVRDPANAEARTRIEAIDAEIAGLRPAASQLCTDTRGS